VMLLVQHLDGEKPVEVKIVRGKIHEETVLGDSRRADGSWNFLLSGEHRLGYVRLASFLPNTADQLQPVLRELTNQGMKGLILDLRNDPGGIFKAAYSVCDLFVPEGIIVTTQGRNGQVWKTFKASGAAPYAGLPLVVLVNQYSASASEIVAACLQDHRRAAVIGQRTYGKGTVQEIFELDRRSGTLRLTTAGYVRPSGKNIHRRRGARPEEDWGVRPDSGYEVILSPEEFERWQRWRLRRDASHAAAEETAPEDDFHDRQREKAVVYLHEQIQKKHHP
jgi:carboxyl-terminal processing protease